MTDPVALYSQLANHFRQREWRQVLDVASQLLPLAPGHPGVYYLAGMSMLELRRAPQAVTYLRRAAELEPDRALYGVHYAKALMAANLNRDATLAADKAATLSCSDPSTLDTLGFVQSQLGSYRAAIAAFSRAIALAPRHAPYRYNLATALVAAGEIKAAEAEIETCLTLDPHYSRAHLTLAQLQRQTPQSNHVARLLSLLSTVDRQHTDPGAAMHLHLALSKEYEDLASYPQAIEHLVKGKAVASAGGNDSSARDEQLFAAIMRAFPAVSHVADGYPTDEPIFIIGMPRTGTTLVERIVSSHPDVHSAGELLNFAMSLKHFSRSRSSALVDADVIAQTTGLNWHALGEMYLSSTRPSTGEKPHFIDKLPHNFLYAGFIANALPKAKIICLRRNPMDTCLSNFRQLFFPDSPFFNYSFDLLDTGRYYVLFDRLMAHWQRVLPGRILEVNYEELVDSQEARTRQIIEFCGLRWDDQCLRFEENPVPVATASAVQVRAPMYRTALGRWKKYGSALLELEQLLARAGIRVES